uniref:Uncharacterized protein n=1 Tax=Rhizophora mucronata TaxID=61149 RepID=A0A2P2QWV6_RHIMU
MVSLFCDLKVTSSNCKQGAKCLIHRTLKIKTTIHLFKVSIR